MNSYGKLFKVTLYGESHQNQIGILIEGIRAGLEIDLAEIRKDLSSRRPGSVGTTTRVEKDLFEIKTGVFNNVTTGSPINIIIPNNDTISKDYSNLINHPRPGHSDLVARIKYHGFNDYRGGGRFSGRLTAALVVAGSIAKQIIPFKVSNKLIQIGELTNLENLDEYLQKISDEGDSVGGVVEVKATNMIPGLGEPFFYKMEAQIAQMMMSIPAVKGVMVGTGFDGVKLTGSKFNDLILDETGKTKTNNSGGVNGGITNGNDLIVKVFIKPTSSIKKPQKTYSFKDEKIKELRIEGRHDVAIIRRAGIVLENALAIVLADMYLLHLANEAQYKNHDQ